MGSAPAEAAVLLAVAACPSLLIPFGENPFEPHKAALLWTVSIIGVAAFVPSYARLRVLLIDQWWTRWLAIAASSVAVALVLSALLSPAPSLAWWGSGLRRYGAFTELALLCIMVTAAALFANPIRFERVVTACVLGSAGPTVYALSQWFGVDPLAPDAGMWSRPGSTFGNPLWLSGYLAAVIPLTLACAWDSRLRLQRRGAAVLVVLQATVLLATRSRGPVLAIGVAATVFAVAMLASHRQRRLAAIVGLATAVTAAAAVVIVPRWIALRTANVAELLDADDRGQATIAVRALLWRAAGSGISGGPLHLAFGSGPESMTRVLTGYPGGSLRLLEGPESAPDRAHNDTLDRIVMFGAAGLAAHFMTIYVALGAAFAALGMLRRSDAMRFAALAAIVVVVTTAGGWLLDGAWTLAISGPAAFLIVASLWVTWRGGSSIGPTHANAVWVASATACWVAHFIDIQTSIASVATAVVGTVALALTVACAARSSDAADAARAGGRQTIDDGVAVVAGLVPTLMLIALTTPAAGTTAWAWTLTAIVWILVNVVIGGQGRAIALSGGVLMAAAVVWLPLSDSAGGPTVQGRALADRVYTLYVMLAGAFVIVTWRLTQRRVSGREILVQSVAMTVAATVVGRAAVHVSAADVLMGAGRACEERRDWTCATGLYADAIQLDGSDAREFTRLARVLVDRADLQDGASQRDELFREAAGQLARGSAANPFDYHHARNRGALERLRARKLPWSERGPHLDEADRWYGTATTLAPSVPTLWAEWANLKLEQRRPDEALPMLEHSAALGSTAETSTLCDLLLRAIGVDVEAAGGLAAAGAALRTRGYPRLADLYATRAAAAGGTAR